MGQVRRWGGSHLEDGGSEGTGMTVNRRLSEGRRNCSDGEGKTEHTDEVLQPASRVCTVDREYARRTTLRCVSGILCETHDPAVRLGYLRVLIKRKTAHVMSTTAA